MRGFSLIELLVLIAIILVIITVALPVMARILMNSAETIVIREVQTIAQAQTQYQSQFGRYAATLAELGPAHGAADSPAAAGLIPAKLASGEKDGYLFTLTSTAGGYVVSATPKSFGSTGRRTFYLDQNGVVHHNWGPQPATDASPEARLDSHGVVSPTSEAVAYRVYQRSVCATC
jgi:type IV pilus assembly protein PilA